MSEVTLEAIEELLMVCLIKIGTNSKVLVAHTAALEKLLTEKKNKDEEKLFPPNVLIALSIGLFKLEKTWNKVRVINRN